MPRTQQSVLFSRHRSPPQINGGNGWRVEDAQAWLRASQRRVGKTDTTAEWHRFRQHDPDDCDPKGFTTVKRGYPIGIQVITCVE